MDPQTLAAVMAKLQELASNPAALAQVVAAAQAVPEVPTLKPVPAELVELVSHIGSMLVNLDARITEIDRRVAGESAQIEARQEFDTLVSALRTAVAPAE